MNGGNFWNGFAAGALSSIASSLWQGGSHKTTNSEGVTSTRTINGIGGVDGGGTTSMIAFGTIAGGAGAALTGGNFWQGAVTGLIVSGLNHALHDGDIDPPGKKKANTTSNETKSDFGSGSAIAGYEGMVLSKAEILIKSGVKGSNFSTLRHASKTLKLTNKVGKSLGVVGIALTTYEDFNNGGLTWGTAAKVALGGGLLFVTAPVAIGYAVLDIGWGIATGTTITDNIGIYVNNKTK